MITSRVLMIRPHVFGFNEQTAVNNMFQAAPSDTDSAAKALQEFDNFVAILRSHGVIVDVVQDDPDPPTPDAIFPNNWFSLHENGQLFLYPMFAPNRRAERKPAVLTYLEKNFFCKSIIDLSYYEQQGLFLEGTGSMVLDHDAKIAFACLSPRTHATVLADFCNQAGYTSCTFHAVDAAGHSFYHTNVMMTVTSKQVIVCMESIVGAAEQELVRSQIASSQKELVQITLSQVASFAGNLLELKGKGHRPLLVMSTRAFQSLTTYQREQIGRWNDIIHCPLPTIESCGGGSARCMLAEIRSAERNM